jgi:hypothetical protein
VGPWLAFLGAIVAAGIVMPQVGKWMPLCCIVTLVRSHANRLDPNRH